ncbi:MAG: hypothetical protein GKR87_08850 [Kiritimatiellae bacterium]|nr:hypothetical protein [Kiritimatiellia bacterium]
MFKPCFISEVGGGQQKISTNPLALCANESQTEGVWSRFYFEPYGRIQFLYTKTWIRQLNAVFCTNHLGQKELQKSLDVPSGCACVFLQPFASKPFAQKSHV